jgi:hypothetical protein
VGSLHLSLMSVPLDERLNDNIETTEISSFYIIIFKLYYSVFSAKTSGVGLLLLSVIKK